MNKLSRYLEKEILNAFELNYFFNASIKILLYSFKSISARNKSAENCLSGFGSYK